MWRKMRENVLGGHAVPHNFESQGYPRGCSFTLSQIYFSRAGAERSCSVQPNFDSLPLAILDQFNQRGVNGGASIRNTCAYSQRLSFSDVSWQTSNNKKGFHLTRSKEFESFKPGVWVCCGQWRVRSMERACGHVSKTRVRRWNDTIVWAIMWACAGRKEIVTGVVHALFSHTTSLPFLFPASKGLGRHFE